MVNSSGADCKTTDNWPRISAWRRIWENISLKSKRHQTWKKFPILSLRELFGFFLQPPPSFAKATDGKPQGLLSVDFFACKKGAKRLRRMSSIARRATEDLNSYHYVSPLNRQMASHSANSNNNRFWQQRKSCRIWSLSQNRFRQRIRQTSNSPANSLTKVRRLLYR